MTNSLPAEDVVSKASTGIEQFLTFRLSGDVYGINILRIREIIDVGHITKVPMMPDSVAGVINLRGSVVPVVELACRFSGVPSEKTKRSSIIIVEVDQHDEKMVVGVAVDVVNEVVDLSAHDIEPTPSFGMQIRTDFISGMGKTQGNLLIILNTDVVLSVDELSIIDNLSAAT